MSYYTSTNFLSLTLLGLLACLGGPAAAGEDTVGQGEMIWRDKAGCQDCHGWAGDGKGGFHHEGMAPSLRVTKLTRDQIRMTIQCGRPATPMPHFDRFAYTDKRCFNATAEELGNGVPNNSGTALQPYEIDAVADFVTMKVKGAGPVTRQQCLDYFHVASGVQCASYPGQ